jgi:presenilin-like A22 family membrane protease
MNRIWTLTLFLIRDLFLSLAGIVPLAAALAFGMIAFEYGMDQSQFITVGGLGIGAICLLTVLLLASRANRAWTYPLLARLHRRTELLAALVLGGVGLTTGLAILITVANLLAGRLTLSFPSLLWILPTWLALWLLAAALALPLSALIGRGGSHLAGWVLLTALLVANDQKARLTQFHLDWLARITTSILWPVNNLLSRGSAGSHDRTYFVALGLTFVCAALLFGLASQTLEEKDLLWTE